MMIITMMTTWCMWARDLNYFGGLFFLCQDMWCMGGKCDNNEGYLNWEHPFRRVSGYKRRSDNKDDIMEGRVYSCEK